MRVILSHSGDPHLLNGPVLHNGCHGAPKHMIILLSEKRPSNITFTHIENISIVIVTIWYNRNRHLFLVLCNFKE